MFDFGIYFFSLVFLLQVLQKCQVGVSRLAGFETRAAEWTAEKNELRKALEAKDGLLKEVASKNASLAADLEQAHAELGQLREETKE